jgi:hypothetical protein
MMVLDRSMLLPKSNTWCPQSIKGITILFYVIHVVLELDTPIGLETISTNKNDDGR